MTNNITWHSPKVSRAERYHLNGHKSCVLWFTGLSGSGKSTLAMELERALFIRSIRSYVLDGDNIRHGLNIDLRFSAEDRKENIRRIGEVSKLFVDAGLFTLAAFISPFKEDRRNVRNMFEAGEFVEIYVKCALEECERRDPKGIYVKARNGEIRDFTGVSSPYEIPEHPELTIETDRYSLDNCINQILYYLESKKFI